MGARSTTTGTGIGPRLAPAVHAFSLLNLCVFVVLTAVAGHLYKGLVLNEPSAVRVFGRAVNASYSLLICLVTGAVGISTTLFGLMHVTYWNEITRIATLAVNVITLALVTLATASAGRSRRSGQTNGPGGYFTSLLVLYGLTFLMLILQFFYVVALAVTRAHTPWAAVVGPHQHNGVVGHHKNVDVNASTDTAGTNGVAMA